MKNIGIIGFGNMGEAFAAGLPRLPGGVRLGVVETVPARAAAAKESFGAEDFTGRLEDFFAFAEIVVLAVKPQDAEALLQNISPHSRDRKFISIVAGKTLARLGRHLRSPYLARFMPNLAAVHGKAAVGVSFGDIPRDQAGEGFRREALEMAAVLGGAVEVPESLLPVMTGLSGSGIAFVFSFVHALALGGVKSGLAYDRALAVAVSVVEGAAAVLRAGGENPAALISRVASPAGTTIAGLQELEDAGFTAGVMRAVEAASLRARELEGA